MIEIKEVLDVANCTLKVYKDLGYPLGEMLVVIRQLTPTQIVEKYYDYLKKEDIIKLLNK